MTARSLILSPPEVRAALAGTLGLVVRPVLRPKTVPADYIHDPALISEPGMTWWRNPEFGRVGASQRCPIGVPGDRLCCKETWCVGAWRDYEDDPSKFAFDYQATPEIVRTPWVYPPHGDFDEELNFRERILSELSQKNIKPVNGRYVWEPGKGPLSWRSPATMPAWASRITLEVVGVRVCRAQDLTEDNAIASGIEKTTVGSGGTLRLQDVYGGHAPSALSALSDLWDSKYAKRGFAWGTNPFVWAVEVRRAEG